MDIFDWITKREGKEKNKIWTHRVFVNLFYKISSSSSDEVSKSHLLLLFFDFCC